MKFPVCRLCFAFHAPAALLAKSYEPCRPANLGFAMWEQVNKLRTLKGLPEPFAVDSGNMGSAWAKIDGEMDEVISAFSSYDDEAGFAILRDNRHFDTLKVNSQQIVDGVNAYDRMFDSEAKILEEIAAKLGNKTGVTGTINLYTERACCPSCEYVIQQFQQKYPNIIINVLKGKP